ncbi:DUF1493 family protein [Chitinophaga sedimenti]|uniref:DUF1493 family protein n=1 Tax=Chitinophaga sedimenti TaxID=2033606 RepID=UPI0020069290|nr:DUF1493 family protein [Chitinophaga sedimenti]MCK7560225.1 DUF1493 family protein [Chitinophaga sedimenti]
MEDTLNVLRAYLQQKYKIDPLKVTSSTSLLHDFGFKGDDVDEFMHDLIKEFRIEVKRLDLSRFFIGNEPFDFISPVIRFFKHEKVSDKPTITVGDLEGFINTGVLC